MPLASFERFPRRGNPAVPSLDPTERAKLRLWPIVVHVAAGVGLGLFLFDAFSTVSWDH